MPTGAVDTPCPKPYRKGMPDQPDTRSIADDVSPPLRFRLDGLQRDEGFVRAPEFLTFLGNALKVLRRLERKRGGRTNLTYLVVELEIGSATVAFEAPPVDGGASPDSVFDDFASGFAAISNGTIDMLGYDADIVEGFSELVEPLRRNMVRSIELTHGTTDIVLSHDVVPVAAIAAEIETHAVGSLAGFIDALNVHRDHVFYLYPPGLPRRVACVFDRPLLDEVRMAVKRYVTVAGLLEYVEGQPFPHRITVESIDVHPPEDELPSLDSLYGIAPDLTGGVETVTYLRRLRDAAE